MNLDSLVKIISLLVGFPAFLAAAINTAKVFGLPDGVAAKVSFWANLVEFFLVLIMFGIGKVDILYQIDAQLSTGETVLVAFTAFAVQFGLTKLFHFSLKGAPVIGFSYNLNNIKG